MILQLALSCFVAWASLGYWSTEMETVLPSLNLTLSAFPDTSTLMAFGIFVSTAEILIPRLYELPSMVFDNTGNAPNFRWTKPAACLQPNGGEPELRNIVISHHMHMAGFLTIAGIEEEPVRPLPQYCRHLPSRDGPMPSTLPLSPSSLKPPYNACKMVPEHSGVVPYQPSENRRGGEFDRVQRHRLFTWFAPKPSDSLLLAHVLVGQDARAPIFEFCHTGLRGLTATSLDRLT